VPGLEQRADQDQHAEAARNHEPPTPARGDLVVNPHSEAAAE